MKKVQSTSKQWAKHVLCKNHVYLLKAACISFFKFFHVLLAGDHSHHKWYVVDGFPFSRFCWVVRSTEYMVPLRCSREKRSPNVTSLPNPHHLGVTESVRCDPTLSRCIHTHNVQMSTCIICLVFTLTGRYTVNTTTINELTGYHQSDRG